jgi:hypothetical protein
METPQAAKLSLTMPSVYTLDNNKIAGLRDTSDKNVYLHKDNVIAMCPFLSQIVTDFQTKKHGMLPVPCGSSCHHFHIAPETKKVLESSGGGTTTIEKVVQTGRVRVGISCGSGNVSFQIANVKIGEAQSVASQPESQQPISNQGHLRVVKKEE